MVLPLEIAAEITECMGARPVADSSLGGGCIGDVRQVELSDGRHVVAKIGGGGLEVEGFMLAYLGRESGLPVPEVFGVSDALLIMEQLPAAGRLNDAAQHHAADLVAALHDVPGPAFGFERDTVIGGLNQPNPETARWLDFFRDQRLLHMGRQALDAGRLPATVMRRLETLAAGLGEWIREPAGPSLIHGDMWTGNVLCSDGRITGFIDPAIYHADPEIELAFSTLFGTFGDAFFGRYGEHRPLAPGFFEERRDLYNLYPLLVHVRLFGGSYVSSVDKTLRKFGC